MMEVPPARLPACVHRVIGRVCVWVRSVHQSGRARGCGLRAITVSLHYLLASVYVRHASAIRMAWVRVGSRVVDMSVRSTPAGRLCRRLSSFIGDGPGSPLVSGSGATVSQRDWELLAWRLLRVCMHGGWRALLSCSRLLRCMHVMCNKARLSIPPRRSFCFYMGKQRRRSQAKPRSFVSFHSICTAV